MVTFASAVVLRLVVHYHCKSLVSSTDDRLWFRFIFNRSSYWWTQLFWVIAAAIRVNLADYLRTVWVSLLMARSITRWGLAIAWKRGRVL